MDRHSKHLASFHPPSPLPKLLPLHSCSAPTDKLVTPTWVFSLSLSFMWVWACMNSLQEILACRSFLGQCVCFPCPLTCSIKLLCSPLLLLLIPDLPWSIPLSLWRPEQRSTLIISLNSVVCWENLAPDTDMDATLVLTTTKVSCRPAIAALPSASRLLQCGSACCTNAD